MNTDFFAGLISPELVKKHYRKLAMEHHPDRGGSTEIMQAVNVQYHIALSRCDGFKSIDDQGKEHKYHYDQDIEQAIMDKISELLKLRMSGVEICLIGTWLWVRGATKPFKDQLKALSCRWHSKRICWYWKPYSGRTHYNRHADFASLAWKYGFREFKNAEENTMATA